MEPTVSFPENWTPPSELRRALPREARLSGRGLFMTILAIVFLIAVPILYVVMHNLGARRAERTASLRAEGHETQAEITRLKHRSGKDPATVRYAFTADGRRFAGECEVPADRWSSLQKAGFLPVRFLPANPAINHPAAWEEGPLPAWVPVIFPMIFGVVGLMFLWDLRRQAELVAMGLAVVGVVTNCRRTKGGWIARYQFRMKDSAIGKGRSQVRNRLETGTTLCVLYLPENPRRNLTYPGCFYRVEP